MTKEKISYSQLIDHVIKNGDKVSPRGVPTRELIGPQIVFPSYSIINRVGQNLDLGRLEALMWAAGIFDIDMIKKVAPKAKTDLFKYQSNYGPRTGNQFQQAVELLNSDRETRKAIVNLNDKAALEDFGVDIACTNSLQFLIRKNFLHTIVTVRSWDLVYGLPIDMLMYEFINSSIARLTKSTETLITVNVGSLHVYENTMSLAREKSRVPLVMRVDPKYFDYKNFDTFRMSCLDIILKWNSGDDDILSEAIQISHNLFANDGEIFTLTERI
jgi:hypothetical protein